jgi:acyl carrier protein
MDRGTLWVAHYLGNEFNIGSWDNQDKIRDLGMDSLDVIQLEIDMEKSLQTSIPDWRVEEWKTVQNIIDTYNELFRDKEE